MQCFDSVYTSYFTLYSKKLFLKRRCMHEYAFFMHIRLTCPVSRDTAP